MPKDLPSLSNQPNATPTTIADSNTNTKVVIPSPRINSNNDENDLNINQKGTGITLINNNNTTAAATTPRNDQHRTVGYHSFNDDDMSNETSEYDAFCFRASKD
jgi:hypothetical protein